MLKPNPALYTGMATAATAATALTSKTFTVGSDVSTVITEPTNTGSGSTNTGSTTINGTTAATDSSLFMGLSGNVIAGIIIAIIAIVVMLLIFV